MARTAIFMHVVVQPGCRIELSAPAGMHEGDELDVVLLTNDASECPPRSLVDILNSLPSDIGSFASAKEVDAYIHDERDSWEQ